MFFKIGAQLQRKFFPVNMAKFLRTAFFEIPPVAASDIAKKITSDIKNTSPTKTSMSC